MAFCRQMHNRIGPMRGKDTIQLGPVTDIHLLKDITWIITDACQRL